MLLNDTIQCEHETFFVYANHQSYIRSRVETAGSLVIANGHFLSLINNIDQIYSGITSGRVLYGEILYTKMQKPHRLKRNLQETVCKQMQKKINF